MQKQKKRVPYRGIQVKLSKREMEVLEILKEPVDSLKQVGLRLGVSEYTVGMFLHHIRQKYKMARQFVNTIDSLRAKYPMIAYYLRMKAPVPEKKVKAE
jgi:DNA-binding NarL/FixJ family response regulator